MRRRRRWRTKDAFSPPRFGADELTHICEKGWMFVPTRKIHYFYRYTTSLSSLAYLGGQSFGVHDNSRDYVASNNCTAYTSRSIPSTCKSRVFLRALDRKIISRPGTVYRNCSLTVVVLLGYPEQYRRPSVSESTQQLHSGWSQLNSVTWSEFIGRYFIEFEAQNMRRK